MINKDTPPDVPFYGNSFDAVLYDTMALEQVEEVQIETDGVFKYILIELTQREKKGKEPREEKSRTIVRGFEWAEFHGDLISSLSLLMSAMHYQPKHTEHYFFKSIFRSAAKLWHVFTVT